ncbi:MAG: PfkB family carbohydrate kinase [Bacteroidota bacterium]
MENATPPSKNWDIVCAGELLIDCISTHFTDRIDTKQSYRMIPGGSPGNLCMNMARLGNRSALVASIGQDDLGNLLQRQLEALKVHTDYLARRTAPTSLILVSRSRDVARFEAYRSADHLIQADQLPEALLGTTRLFHSTCFGLSRQPAQSSILEAARKVRQFGAQLSIDLNYAAKIWPDREAAQKVVAEYCALEPLVKISEVDWERLYGRPFDRAEEAAHYLLDLGARVVCVTLGGAGCLVADAETQQFLAARSVEVRDTTGAGDAFWSGFLTAWLMGKSPLDCARSGRRMAELKLVHFGPLPAAVDREAVLSGQ